MSWEVILKTEKVWVLSQEAEWHSTPMAVFRSEEAMRKWLINEHGKYFTNREKMTDEEVIKDIFMTYDYSAKEVEMEG